MNSELKPCPFCGGEAAVFTYNNEEYDVKCCNPYCLAKSSCWDTEAEAIAAWNTRHVETCSMEPLNAFYTDLNGLNQTEWGVCSNCGTASPIDATYCCECGRKVER